MKTLKYLIVAAFLLLGNEVISWGCLVVLAIFAIVDLHLAAKAEKENEALLPVEIGEWWDAEQR